VNYTLNVTRETDIARVLESHSWSHSSKTKRFLFYLLSRASAQTKETLSKSMSMRFPVLLSASSFLKFYKMLNFNLSFGKQSFSVNSFSAKVFFPNRSCIFDFTIATSFACNSRQQYRFMRKYNSTLNSLSSLATLPLPIQFLGELIDIEAAYLLTDWCALAWPQLFVRALPPSFWIVCQTSFYFPQGLQGRPWPRGSAS